MLSILMKVRLVGLGLVSQRKTTKINRDVFVRYFVGILTCRVVARTAAANFLKLFLVQFGEGLCVLDRVEVAHGRSPWGG